MPRLKHSIGNPKHISLDDVCSLVSVTYTEDELGQSIEAESERQVFCTVLSITRQEFATAGQLGLKPKIMIVLDNEEYNDEKTVMYDNKRYTVYKDFPRVDGCIELYCEIKVGG